MNPNLIYIPHTIIDDIRVYRRIYIGLSGSLDSTVLLHLASQCPEWKGKVHAIHIHHGIHSDASEWETHCKRLAHTWNIACTVYHVPPQDWSYNLEERAREARYEGFQAHIGVEDCLLLAHHANDQAETVLLHLFRGAGVEGISAMPYRRDDLPYPIFRPLLTYTKDMLYDYARQHRLTWIEDPSNQDTTWSRNYIRHEIMPMVIQKWPQAVSALQRFAEHMGEARQHLKRLADVDYPDLAQSPKTLDIVLLKGLSRIDMKNVLRQWLYNQRILMPSQTILDRVIDEAIFARIDKNPVVSWSEYEVRRYRDTLYVMNQFDPEPLEGGIWEDFPQSKCIGDTQHLCAKWTSHGIHISEGAVISIRYRQGGESLYWRGHHRPLKKIFQTLGVPEWVRSHIPLIFVDDVLVAVVGYAMVETEGEGYSFELR
jgi:tRNA(Ile)-lysidine synthase